MLPQSGLVWDENIDRATKMGTMRGGGIVATELIEKVADQTTNAVQEFRRMQTAIHPEGDDARVTILTTTGQIRLTVPFEYIAHANTEIRRAAIIMLHRQSMKKDAGENALDRILETALQPKDVSLVVDKSNGDRLWVFQFENHGAIVIRMSPEMGAEAAADLAEIIRRTAN